jgi:anaerobic selenocysteine-containing dehydrogenase
MRVTVEDGVAVDLRGDGDHPFTRGFLCQKMARYLDRVYSPERLLHPLRRVGPKGSGRFEPIGWDEALATIAARFAEIAGSADGPQAILPYSYYGTMGKLQASSLDRRFFHRLGPRSSTGPSARRPVRSATSTPSAAAGSAPTRWRSPGAA